MNKMFKNIYVRLFLNTTNIKTTFCKIHTENKIAILNTDKPYNVTFENTVDDFESKVKAKSVLQKCDEDISHVAPYLKPTFNFAAYINKSETLQQLLKLGVNLHKLEKKKDVPEFILGLNFERDVKKYVTFLHDKGLSVDEIGAFITKNPKLLGEDLDNLQVRINYLLCKKFNDDMILRILVRNPFWLMFSTQQIDGRLGHFQKEFSLLGDEVRSLTVRQPKLITYKMRHIKLNTFVLKEEMGFTGEELKSILLTKPILFMKRQENILKTFDYIHNVMKIPLETIAEVPGVLTCREFKVRQRHMFLEKLGRAQYDPKQPNYVSILTLVSGTDGDFCVETAKSSLQAFNMFLKSL